MHDLFRREALEAQGTAFLGAAVLRPPFSFAVWSAIAGALSIAVIAFLLLGTYTKRTRVVGITAPDIGVIKLMAPQAGVVVDRRVQEGEHVKRGAVLFVLSTERMTDQAQGVGGAQTAVLEQLRRRRVSFRDEQDRQSRLNAAQTEALQRRLTDLGAEAQQLEREIGTQAERVRSGEMQLRRFEDLGRQQFMSELAVQQKRDDLLDQRTRLQTMQRGLLALNREQASAAAELRQLPLKGQAQIAELDRAIAAIDQDIASTESGRQIYVAAPEDGMVTAILADRGQTVGSQPLLTLLPAGGRLEAHLYAPSKAIGFVEPGQRVLIRYAAYPYQKFGQYEGTVRLVSRSSIAPSDVPQQIMSSRLFDEGDGLFRVTVGLASPDVIAYGQRHPLTAGLQVDADVLQDTRTLIEWILDPVLGMRKAIVVQ